MTFLDSSDTWPFPASGRSVFTNWGRTAIESVLREEGLAGGTVLVPAFVCPDSLGPLFSAYDLTPRFVDVNPRTYHIDLDAVGSQADVDAVLLVHTFGLSAEADRWAEWCGDGVVLIEDCARALGAKSTPSCDEVVGSVGEYAIYSLSKVTPLTLGGCVISADPQFDPELEPPSDARVVVNALPKRVRKQVSTTYPLSVEYRRLDEGSKRMFEHYVDADLGRAFEENTDRAEAVRDALEPLGFEFQTNQEGRANYVLAASVPADCDRDGLLYFLQALHLPVKPLWPCPWPWVLDPLGARERFPVTARLTETLLGFRIDAMDDASMAETIDAVERYLGEDE